MGEDGVLREVAKSAKARRLEMPTWACRVQMKAKARAKARAKAKAIA
jgi:hypothetical protein